MYDSKLGALNEVRFEKNAKFPHVVFGEGDTARVGNEEIGDKPHLDEADVLGVLPEALSANVEAVLTNQSPVISAHSAAAQHSATLKRDNNPSDYHTLHTSRMLAFTRATNAGPRT